MAPLVKELESRPEIQSICCITAQHRQMLDDVLHLFDITPDYDLDIMEARQSLYTITSNHSFSNQKAVIDLGFNARSADESIIDALNWFFFNKPELLEEKTKKELLAAIEKDEKRKGLAEKLKNALKQKAMRNET